MRAKRLRDLGIYVVVGLIFAGAILFWGANHSDRTGAQVVGKWGGLAANTLIVFGYLIRHNRLRFKQTSFWVTLVVLIFVHLAILIRVLENFQDWRVAWWIVITPIEYAIIATTLIVVDRVTNG